MKTSESLIAGQVYTRRELREMFDISDATINTGVFRPKGHDSVWLFVTEEKSSDRTQYADLLEGDTLHWDGQTSGRTDHLILGHRERGLELLLFYRKTKAEYPGAGFRYEGPVEYVAHKGSHPTCFTLKRVAGLDKTVAEHLEALRREANAWPHEATGLAVA